MPANNNKSYTAVVEIVEVEDTGNSDRGISPTKDKTEVVRLVIRDSDLETLKTKVQAHMALV